MSDIAIGDWVKLGNAAGETFWVTVTGIQKEVYTGIHTHLGMEFTMTFTHREIREYQTSEVAQRNAQLLTAITRDLAEILGYVPSLGEVESLLTRMRENECV